MKRRLLFIGIMSVLSTFLFGQSEATSNGEFAHRLISPFYLGGGMHVTKTESPQGTYLNPAMAAGFQRKILDINYINLQNLTGSQQMGHAANLAFSIPTRRGVITSSIGLLHTSEFRNPEIEGNSAMDLGVSGHLNVAFSKEIYSDMWFGIALVGELGKLDETLQGGGALSIGFLHFPEKVGGLKNFSWGGSVSGLGYRFGSFTRGYLDSIPGNITPAVGMAFDAIHGKKVKLTLRSDLRLPSVTDLWFGVAGDLHLGPSARLSISSSLALRDLFTGSFQTVIPSVSIGFNFAIGGEKKERSIHTTELDIQTVGAPLYDGIWGFGAGIMLPFGIKDTNPPVIKTEFGELQYISPNYDGIQDELNTPYSVEDERYIKSFEWRIVNSLGKPVRTYVNKDERPENETVGNLWARLISPKEGTALPESIRWDGVSDAGSIAPDGKYDVYLQFSDDNDNTSSAGPFPVVIDTVPPAIDMRELEGLDLIFSPDGDGNKDEFEIFQEGSREHLWEAEFRDAAGTAVKKWTWNEDALQSITWNGQDESGAFIGDGVYHYFVQSTDRAGNSNQGAIEGIIIDTNRPRIGLTIDKAVFSPGTSSELSTLVLEADIPQTTGIVNWVMEVVDKNEDVGRVWNRAETALVPGTLIFDGKGNDGRMLPEGEYFARLEIEYGNGFQSDSTSPKFLIDTTPPSAKVRANWSLFSPSGGSRRNQVTFIQESSMEQDWKGAIIDSDGKLVREWSWIEQAERELIWDGRSDVGRLVPDGEYRYYLYSTDRAGNSGQSKYVSVTVDTSTVEASLTASLDVFGPTGNGRKDTVSFYMSAQKDSPLADWSLGIRNANGAEIMRWNGQGSLPDRQEWNGKEGGGGRVSDGQYTAELTVNYVKGDSATARTGPILVDTQPPMIEINVTDRLFSPDGDGQKDSLTIRQRSSQEDRFNASLYDTNGQEVFSWVWAEALKPIEWDGTDESGNALPDGVYRYEVSGRDNAGNETRQEVTGIRIDTAPTAVYLTAKEGYIKAGETDSEKMQSFTAVIPNDEGISSWQFAIEDEEGKSVISKSGKQPVPASFKWNGVDSGGKPIEGVFKGVLNVVYEKGARPRGETRPFISDGSPPVVKIDIQPQPFSPDDDNVDDEAVIGITVEDSSRISEWKLDVFDKRNNPFITFFGRGRPSERIIWDGRSGRGELVESAEDYSYTFTASDILGHSATVKGAIAVDVLVIREGNRLKIRISNLTFQPSSSNFTLTGDEGEKNMQVLDRLAEIMKKYGSYKIIVEGHAASLKWANPAAAKKEQESILLPLSRSRAEAVVKELAKRGISTKRLTADGVGGDKPLVPHSNEEERWRNRRVEFYLEK